MGDRTDPSSHNRHHDRAEETKQETTVHLNHHVISINASCALQQGIPPPAAAAVRLQRPAGAELSSPRCRGSETIWRVTMLESLLWINEGYKLCHKVRLLRLCKWGPGVRKYSELLTLEQTAHISGGCMKIEVIETIVTFWAQKLADNNAFT